MNECQHFKTVVHCNISFENMNYVKKLFALEVANGLEFISMGAYGG